MESPRRGPLEELLPFSEPAQRLARFAELGQYPGGGGDRHRELEDDVPGSEHRDPMLNQYTRLRPVAVVDVEPARGAVGLS